MQITEKINNKSEFTENVFMTHNLFVSLGKLTFCLQFNNHTSE